MAESTAFPPFQLGKSRFDQNTFSGRLRHFLDVIDPRTLFVSELWQAQKIKQRVWVLEMASPTQLWLVRSQRDSERLRRTVPPQLIICVIAGRHPPRHRREDPHALSDVRYGARYAAHRQVRGPRLRGAARQGGGGGGISCASGTWRRKGRSQLGAD
ncbi:hypothetical protein JZ751_012453 [Albula glossodonta]|uniref:Uncharacterized protein n=1 Tax=Albula glossodonta TaxID=121402 RepID=A0A8T2P2Y8_9TELE|nr:hypothetical protein JZ751_012453 [Albula glossodonta]